MSKRTFRTVSGYIRRVEGKKTPQRSHRLYLRERGRETDGWWQTVASTENTASTHFTVELLRATPDPLLTGVSCVCV